MVAPTELRTLTFAHSPDPDDAYMFYGFAKGAGAGFEFLGGGGRFFRRRGI